MQYQFNWHIHERVLGIKLTGRISLTLLHQINIDIIQRLERGTRPIHLILDFREVEDFPPLTHELVASQTYLAYRKLGWVIAYGNNRHVSFLNSVLTQSYHARFRTYTEWEDITEFLCMVDESLCH